MQISICHFKIRRAVLDYGSAQLDPTEALQRADENWCSVDVSFCAVLPEEESLMNKQPRQPRLL